jgi:hypothetical protein
MENANQLVRWVRTTDFAIVNWKFPFVAHQYTNDIVIFKGINLLVLTDAKELCAPVCLVFTENN